MVREPRVLQIAPAAFQAARADRLCNGPPLGREKPVELATGDEVLARDRVRPQGAVAQVLVDEGADLRAQDGR